MKLLAFSDAHLGSGDLHRKDALADQEATLDRIADLARERNVSLVLNAGDTFHRPKPEPATLHVFRRFCNRLAEAEIPMVALGGNGAHDAAPGQPSALELFEARLVRTSRRAETITEFAGVAVCTLPAVPVHRLAAIRNGGDRGALNEEAAELLVQAARDLFAEAPDDRPRILLGHWLLTGGNLPTGLPITESLGLVLPLKELETIGYDTMIFGDVHEPQSLESTPFLAAAPAFYCGSPMRHDFGDAGTEHGVWIVDYAEGTAPEFVRLEDRRFVTVDVDLGPGAVARVPGDSLSAVHDVTDVIALVISAELPLDGAVVRVKYRAAEEDHRRVDQPALLRLLEDAGVHRVYGGIQWEPVRQTRARIEGVDESVSPQAALELWLTANEIPDGEPLKGLLDRYLVEETA